jgi:hypothetical protein
MKPFIPTKKALELLDVGYDGFKTVCKKYGIEPRYRSGQGNMYAVDELLNLDAPTRQESPFDRC